MRCETKGNSTSKGKPRVYFTCHPEDFEGCFRKVCDDIFKTHDCAIYYTEDMGAEIPKQNWATDLESNNLFVIPITFKLLTTPNRAMDKDFPFAREKHIPVLPLMMEEGIDEIFSRLDRFGTLQYIDPYSTDTTQISYADKLKKYLESVLVGDELAKRVRAAFDAYIFLSYRKKDRHYANELMRIIHSSPECRDIAIWFDEFLTPGESFRENIDKILRDSKLFALLVTPNLLEEQDGKPNFVMGEEYPAAHKAGIEILPAEMEETDREALRAKYDGLPECVNAYDDEQFRERLLNSLKKVAVTVDNDDPEHMFLIGLAYLDGIDVEVDRECGLRMITAAAEEGLFEARHKLYYMYTEGIGVEIDYREAERWAEVLAEHFIENYGMEHPETLVALNNLATTYYEVGDYQNALRMNENIYTLSTRVLGEAHPTTLMALNSLATSYSDFGDYETALTLTQRAYMLCCESKGIDHPDTMTLLNNLAMAYHDLGSDEDALELSEMAYTLRRSVLGERHPDTLASMGALAVVYCGLHEAEKALELTRHAYEISCDVQGAEHPDTLTILGNLATSYAVLGDHEKAFELSEKAYMLRCKVLGEKHPRTLVFLSNLAFEYFKRGDRESARTAMEKVYILSAEVLGEEHPKTQMAYKRLSRLG